MKEVKAARLLTCWRANNRKTVAVTKREYDELLFKVPPLFMGVNEKDSTVQFVTLDKEQATRFLKAEYNLHGVKDD